MADERGSSPANANEGGDDHEDTSYAPGTNFWDIGNYKVVLKRISNGAKLCDELIKMVHERTAVEKACAKLLSGWAEKWEDRLEKINEFGSLKEGWKGLFTEAKELALTHSTIKDKIDIELKLQVEEWKKEHYAKSFFSYKTSKRAGGAFEKAQSQWVKRKETIGKHKKDMNSHKASLHTLQKATFGEDKAAIEEAKKQKANIAKEEAEIEKVKEKLMKSVAEMVGYAPTYEQEMRLEFNRCQEEERERIEFFKRMLQRYFQESNISKEIDDAHRKAATKVDMINSDADLALFSRDFGADMPMLLPDNEGNFFPRGTKGVADVPNYAPHEFPPQPDVISPGKGVRALYDYDAQNADELSFKTGDLITVVKTTTQLSEGWLSGQKTDGSKGIFPANYVSMDSSES